MRKLTKKSEPSSRSSFSENSNGSGKSYPRTPLQEAVYNRLHRFRGGDEQTINAKSGLFKLLRSKNQYQWKCATAFPFFER